MAGTAYSPPELMTRLGLDFEGCRTIDGSAFSPDHFAEWIGEAALQEGFTGWTSI